MKTHLLNALIAVLLLLIPMLNFAQAPTLGTAANFVLFTSVGAVTNSGIPYMTRLTGNVGTNSAPTITGFGNIDGQMHYVSDPVSAQCAADLQGAYNSLQAAIPDSTVGVVIGNGDTIRPGIFLMPGAASLNLSLTLNGKGNPNSVFIFKTSLAFSTSANAKIKLINGAQACNVFWWIGGAVNISSGTFMRGTIISGGAISLGTGDTLEGRAMTIVGAILTDQILGYTPVGCGSPVLNGPVAPALGATAGYVVFSSIGDVTDDGTSHLTGDVGTNSGSTTGYNPLFVDGMIHPSPDPSTAAAAGALTIVYNYLNLHAYDINLLFPAQFGHNLVLTPHTYLLDAATLLTDTVYLNAMGNVDAVFIIQVNGALSTTAFSKVILINGTQAKNVYWNVDGAVNIMNNSVFKGTIVAGGAITFGLGSSLDGRAFTIVGAITTTGINANLPTTSIVQPTNQTVCVGGTATFTVSVTASNPTYQWRKGNVNLVNGGNISGVNTSTLTISPVALSDAAPDYNVVIAGSVVPSITSANASLTVNPLPVPVISGPASACINSTGNIYSTATGMTGYIWSVSAGGIITAGTGTNAITVTWNTTGSKTVSVNYTNSNNCTAANPTVYNVTVVPLPVPTITGPAASCVATTGHIYVTQAGMTGYIWTISAGGIITNGAGTNTITVSWNVIGAQSVSVNYTNPGGCTAAASVIYNVTVNPRPVPTISGPASTCVLSSGNIYTTQAGMTAYDWTISSGGTIISGTGTNIITVTWNSTGAQNLTVNYTNASGCSAASAVIFPVIVNPLPVPTISGLATICSGLSATYTTQAGMTNYLWTVSAGGTITAGGTTTSNTVTVKWVTAGAQSVSVNYSNVNGCSATAPANYNVNVNATPVPYINAYNTPCANNVPVDYYTQGGMLNYVWTVTAGGTITSGQGTDNVQISWSVSGMGTVSVTYTSPSGCAAAAPGTYTVYVNSMPAAAGPVTGTSAVCAGATGIAYSTAEIPFALSYVWSLPAGATIATGAGTRNITVDFSATASSGNIAVAGNNICGNGTFSPNFPVTVTALPAAAGSVTGPTVVCTPSAGNVYTILPVLDATSYSWTVPAGATITSGASTNSITVSFSLTASSGNVSVYGSNSCGAGSASSLEVSVTPVPETPVITVNGEILTSSAPTGNQWYFEGVLIPGATGQTHQASLSGVYTTIVTINGCSSQTSAGVYVVMTGIDEKTESGIQVYPVPNDGKFTVSISAISQEIYTIEIFNNLGVMIKKLAGFEVNGKVEKVIDLRPAPNGIYIVVIQSSSTRILKRVVVDNK